MAVVRVRPLALAVFVAMGLVLGACSGAGNTDLFEGTPEQEQAATTASTAPSAIPGAANDAATHEDADVPVSSATDAGLQTSPPKPPSEPACTPEAEPNNDIGHATPFETRLCGKIDTTNDVDYGKFEAPEGVSTVTLSHIDKNGTINYRVLVEGISVPLLQGNRLQVTQGATYSVLVRSNGGARPSYELDLAFQ